MSVPPKAPAKTTPEPPAFEDMSPFERLREFMRRIVAVPKSEVISIQADGTGSGPNTSSVAGSTKRAKKRRD